jgi:hypothetical protein
MALTLRAKKIVGGFFVINAEDINEAVSISKDFPDLTLAVTVQVRQVMKIEM